MHAFLRQETSQLYVIIPQVPDGDTGRARLVGQRAFVLFEITVQYLDALDRSVTPAIRRAIPGSVAAVDSAIRTQRDRGAVMAPLELGMAAALRWQADAAVSDALTLAAAAAEVHERLDRALNTVEHDLISLGDAAPPLESLAAALADMLWRLGSARARLVQGAVLTRGTPGALPVPSGPFGSWVRAWARHRWRQWSAVLSDSATST